MMWTEEMLDDMLETPSAPLREAMSRIRGNVLILGAGGKMGPSLAILARNALAGTGSKVIAVSRFQDQAVKRRLMNQQVDVISADLLESGVLDTLPDADHVIYMAGRKFGTRGTEHETWAMNAWLPVMTAQRYSNANIVVFSTGNVYPQMPLHSGGATEQVEPAPIGEYGMSCLARERVFEHAAMKMGTSVCLFRLNYAVDLRYGVFHDIAMNILNKKAISLDMPVFNCIWQQSANEMALRCLLHCTRPAHVINITGPELVSVRKSACKLGKMLGMEPIFTGEEKDESFISDASHAFSLFGYPSVNASTMLTWQAQWLLDGGRSLNKPTHFEEKKGRY